jgi:hypothetical protein
MNHHDDLIIGAITRREFLQRTGLGLGSLALACLLESEAAAAPAVSREGVYNDLRPRSGHFPGQARAVIQLNQEGGPSHVDLFDPKPELVRRNGQPHPHGVEAMSPANKNILMASPFRFRRHGQCGMELSELIPRLGEVADELCLVRSMFTEHNNHPEANAMIHTGKTFAGRPTMGAWVSYALGTENQNLPAFIVLRDPRGYGGNTKRAWTNGWLPALYQGVEFSSRGRAVHHLTPDEPNSSKVDIAPGRRRGRCISACGVRPGGSERVSFRTLTASTPCRGWWITSRQESSG